MKKSFLILILVAGLAALPYVNGMLTETMARQMLQKANQNPALQSTGIQIKITRYHRGYKSSQVEWSLDTGSLKALYGIDDIRFSETITHGITGVTSETHLTPNPWYAQWTQTIGRDPLHITTRYPIMGDIVSNITLDPFDITTPDGSLAIKAIELKTQVNKGLDKFSYNADGDGLSMVKTGGKTLSVGRLSMKGDQTQVTDYLWDGRTEFTIADILLKNFETHQLKDLSVEINQDVDLPKGIADITMGAGLAKLSRGNHQEWGGKISLGLEHLNVEILKNISRIYNQTMGIVMAEIGTSRTQSKAQAMVERAMEAQAVRIMAELKKMLKKDLKLRISDVDIFLPQGRIRGKFSLALKEDVTLMQLYPLMMQPAMALPLFRLESDFTVSPDLMDDSFTQPLFPGMQTGLFIPQEDQFHHHGEIKDNQLFINDREVLLN